MIDPQTCPRRGRRAGGPRSATMIRFVHDHPELGHEEHECSRYLCDTFAAAGLERRAGVAGMDTAFRATLHGRDGPGASVGFVCLYDAVAAVRPDGRTDAVHSLRPRADRRRRAPARRSRSRQPSRRARRARSSSSGCPADEIHAPGTIVRGGGKALTRRGGRLGRRRRGPLRAPRVHRHGVARVALDAPRDGDRRRLTRARDRRPAAVRGGARPRSRWRARRSRTTSCSSGSSSTATSRRRRASCSKATFLLFGDEEQEVETGLRRCRTALPDATWSVGGLVRGGSAGRPRHRCGRRRLPRARPRLRRRSTAAPLRDGLREHLAPLSGGADRRRPTGRLEVPHGRGRGASSPRRTARRRRRRSRRCSRSPRSSSSIRRLARAGRASPERSQEKADPADRLRLRVRTSAGASSRASLRDRLRTASSAPRRRCRATGRPYCATAPWRSSSVAMSTLVPLSVGRRAGADRRLGAALALDLARLHGEHGDPFRLESSVLPHLGSELERYRPELDASAAPPTSGRRSSARGSRRACRARRAERP